MAKKKKRKQNRRPIAPPVHSAPEAVHAPPTRAAEPFTARPESPEPPAAAAEPLRTAPVYEPEPERPRRQPPKRRPPARRRRRRSNASRWVIVGLVIVAIVGAFVARSVLNGKRSGAFSKVAAAADCGKVKSYSNLDRTHTTGSVKYSTSPPVGGAHNPSPLPGGVYDNPLSTDPSAKTPTIYSAVHSLEHGYVIVWYKNLSADEKDALTKALTGQQKVIVVPYPDMPDGHKMALTAWGKLDYCGKPSVKAADAFVTLYRNSPSAPEYYQPAI
jgi:hypothetical protein